MISLNNLMRHLPSVFCEDCNGRILNGRCLNERLFLMLVLWINDPASLLRILIVIKGLIFILNLVDRLYLVLCIWIRLFSSLSLLIIKHYI